MLYGEPVPLLDLTIVAMMFYFRWNRGYTALVFLFPFLLYCGFYWGIWCFFSYKANYRITALSEPRTWRLSTFDYKARLELSVSYVIN